MGGKISGRHLQGVSDLRRHYRWRWGDWHPILDRNKVHVLSCTLVLFSHS